MKFTLIIFISSFIEGRLSSEEFVNAYQELWKIERDNNFLKNYPNNVNECLSTAFCLTDLYSSDSEKKEYELDEQDLRNRLNNLLNKMI